MTEFKLFSDKIPLRFEKKEDFLKNNLWRYVFSVPFFQKRNEAAVFTIIIHFLRSKNARDEENKETARAFTPVNNRVIFEP